MQSQIIAIPKLFIGMDIHKKSWSVHLRTDLFDHKGFSMPPEPKKLADFVISHFADHEVALTYEAGCCGFSAARYFLNMGWTSNCSRISCMVFIFPLNGKNSLKAYCVNATRSSSNCAKQCQRQSFISMQLQLSFLRSRLRHKYTFLCDSILRLRIPSLSQLYCLN